MDPLPYGYGYPYNQAPTTNSTPKVYSLYNLNIEDANWIMTSSFIIFTMQTGFGLLESGCVSIKNEVNIMMKNVVDIVLGGLTYWLFGFGLSFGESKYSNPFITFGDFSMNPSVDNPLMGPMLAAFLFQLSFATTATTIVSGAMAERCNFRAYCLFSSLNTIVYVLPAGWVWGDHGFLKNLGAVDIAGSGPVHLVGGSSAFISAIMLGPRLGRYLNGTDSLPLGSPVNAVMGLFVLWWGWLAFNSGSTYGLSGYRWHYAARAAVMTVLASFGGGLWGLLYALYTSNSGSVDVLIIINSVLGSLVSVTGGCFLYNAWQSIIIGLIGGAITCITTPLIDKLGVDDPVGATSVHGICGFWGVIAIGFFAIDPKPLDTTNNRKGVFAGGGWYLLGVQTLMCVCLMAWSMLTTFILLWGVNKIIPIRMDPHEELLGADLAEHRIRHPQVGISRAMSALNPVLEHHDLKDVSYIGFNPGHEAHIDEFYNITNSSNYKLSQISLLKQKLDEKTKNNKNVLSAVEEMKNGQISQKKDKGKTVVVKPNSVQETKSNNSSATKARRFRNAVEILSHMQKNNKKPQIAWLD